MTDINYVDRNRRTYIEEIRNKEAARKRGMHLLAALICKVKPIMM